MKFASALYYFYYRRRHIICVLFRGRTHCEHEKFEYLVFAFYYFFSHSSRSIINIFQHEFFYNEFPPILF